MASKSVAMLYPSLQQARLWGPLVHWGSGVSVLVDDACRFTAFVAKESGGPFGPHKIWSEGMLPKSYRSELASEGLAIPRRPSKRKDRVCILGQVKNVVKPDPMQTISKVKRTVYINQQYIDKPVWKLRVRIRWLSLAQEEKVQKQNKRETLRRARQIYEVRSK